jgi:hypothetical protein
LENRDSLNGVDTSTGKHDYARHRNHFSNHEVASTAAEVSVNTVKVASFAPIAEAVMPSFFIDFSDAQTAVSDAEINHQMEENLVEISLPGTELADMEIIGQMEQNLVEISLPDTKDADAEINENFTAK